MKNRKQMVIATVFSILFMAYFTTGGQVFAQDVSSAGTIVCLGDSYTTGYGATVVGKEDKSKSWPAFLQNKVNIPVINAGVSGDTTAHGLTRVKKDVLSQNPGIVIIELGGNDFLRKIPMSTIKRNLQKIIDMVNDGERKIYIVMTVKEILNLAVFAPHKSMYQQYEDMVNALALANNIETAYIGDGVFGGKENMSADGFHPNVKGYEIFADQIFNALKPYLEANNLLKE
jgi:acyl-CoA thioesterase-1